MDRAPASYWHGGEQSAAGGLHNDDHARVIAGGRAFEPALSSKESAASKNFVLACSGFCEAKRVAKFAPGALE